MSLRTESMPDNPRRIAIFYGPILLAAPLGAVEDPAAANSDYVPVLVTDNQPVDKWVQPVQLAAREFTTHGVGRPHDVALLPFFSLHDQRYTVYLDVFTQPEWTAREAELRAQQERERELQAHTIDMLRIGEMQPERDHQLTGERTGAGEHLGRKWRHATDGGWFAFEMAVAPDEENSLMCTYWGSEVGPRTFDILIDGQKIAEQTLANDARGQFFDVTYAIPQDLTRGKSKVTVRLQGHPQNFAGGLFGNVGIEECTRQVAVVPDPSIPAITTLYVRRPSLQETLPGGATSPSSRLASQAGCASQIDWKTWYVTLPSARRPGRPADPSARVDRHDSHIR